MKICAIICEYNPFHNGHLYHIQEAKRLTNADYILCLMSGNFVQRGDAAVLDKFTRAKHAVQAGADIVLELPTVFATSNAEIFAKGAIHLLSSIPAVESLCFGAENADSSLFLRAAKLMNDEPEGISTRIKTLTDNGLSYAKARAEAWSDLLPKHFINSPNNILGIEYTRAILSCNAPIDILPITRQGNPYHSTSLEDEYSSASAIREAMKKDICVKKNVPAWVLPDLSKYQDASLEILEKFAILCNSPEKIASVCDCTEGLENAFKKAALLNTPLADELTSARYTSSRIRRIALQNLLGTEEKLIRECLKSSLYLRVLAMQKDKKGILSELSKSSFPLLLRAHDSDILEGVAKQSLQKDIFAENIYNLIKNCCKNNKNLFYEG